LEILADIFLNIASISKKYWRDNMPKTRWLVLPFLLLFLLGCGLISGVQNIQNAASTVMPAISSQLPSILTSAPTTQGMIETFAAQGSSTSSQCTGTPTAGGLGISLDHVKTMLQSSQQFAIKDGSVDGQPVSTVTLASDGSSNFSAIANGFSAQFIGDPCNLSRVLVTAPYTDKQETIDQGLTAATGLFFASIPLDIQVPLMFWLSQNYKNVPVSGEKQTTIKNMQFTLKRTQSEMSLEIVPVK
jgi:hypothetical protein